MVMMVCRIFEYDRSTRVDSTGTALNLKSVDKLEEYCPNRITAPIYKRNRYCKHVYA